LLQRKQHLTTTLGWWRGVVVTRLIREVTVRWARLVLRCVTACGQVNYLGM